MLTINLVPVLLTLLLAAGQLVLNPDMSAATVGKAGEQFQAEHVTPNGYPNAPIPLPPQLSEPDMLTPVATNDAFMRVAKAPTETCSGKWELELSHKSWRCIDGHWQQITDEQWTCKKPQQKIDHTYQQRTQDTCSAS
jgi:hypothetical protein